MGLINKIKFLAFTCLAFASLLAIATDDEPRFQIYPINEDLAGSGQLDTGIITKVLAPSSTKAGQSTVQAGLYTARKVGNAGVGAQLFEVNNHQDGEIKYYTGSEELVDFSGSDARHLRDDSFIGQGIKHSDPICESPEIKYPDASKVMIPKETELNPSQILSQITQRINGNSNPNEDEDLIPITPIPNSNSDDGSSQPHASHSDHSSHHHHTRHPHYPSNPTESNVLDRNLGSIQTAAQRTLEYNSGRQIASRAESRMRELENYNYDDQKLLTQSFTEQTPEELYKRLPLAQEYILNDLRLIEQRHAALEKEKDRYRAIYLNAFDKTKHAEAFLSTFAQEKLQQVIQPFSGLFAPRKDNPLAKVDAFKEIFGEQKPLESAASVDSLVNRTMMLASLPKEKRKELLEKLNLVESVSVKLPNGKKENLNFLHTGYVFGGGKTAIDCSSFVSSLLPIELRKSNLTTMDFYGIYTYLTTGKMPKPPEWDPMRARWLKKIALSFMPVDIYKGQHLIPGDLLVVRIVIKNSGHILIVKDFDPKTASTDVIEASFTSGKINTRKFPLSLDPVGSKKRYFRPGLFALRLSTQPQACQYASDDSARRFR